MPCSSATLMPQRLTENPAIAFILFPCKWNSFSSSKPGSKRTSLIDPLAAQPTAAYNQNVAMNMVAGLRCQKDSSSGQIGGSPPTPRGNALQNLPRAIAVFAERVGVVGLHIAGGDGVDVDSPQSLSLAESMPWNEKKSIL